MNASRYTEIAEECRRISEELESGDFNELINQVEKGIRIVARSSSNSWIGYHAAVYFRGFRVPPPGDHFSSEWGLREAFSNHTSENWIEFSYEDVEKAINAIAGNKDYSIFKARSGEVIKLFNKFQNELVPMLNATLDDTNNKAFEELRDKAKMVKPFLSVDELVSFEMPKGQFTSRDSLAISQGIQAPHHILFSCNLKSLGSPFVQIGELAQIAELAYNYIRHTSKSSANIELREGKVFIGHGHSQEWRTLSDFLQNRLHLRWDEYNRESTAGLSVKERIEAMLSDASFAFLLLTAEDEHSDTTLHARENVIHEVGLFQGRLGYRRAIIVLEDGCQEFSNIQGIGQIRFPKGQLRAAFEEIRQVLEREGLLPSTI